MIDLSFFHVARMKKILLISFRQEFIQYFLFNSTLFDWSFDLNSKDLADDTVSANVWLSTRNWHYKKDIRLLSNCHVHQRIRMTNVIYLFFKNDIQQYRELTLVTKHGCLSFIWLFVARMLNANRNHIHYMHVKLSVLFRYFKKYYIIENHKAFNS